MLEEHRLKKGDVLVFPNRIRKMQLRRCRIPLKEYLCAKRKCNEVWVSASALTRTSKKSWINTDVQETLWYLYHQRRGLLRLSMYLCGRSIVCQDIQYDYLRMSDGTLRRVEYPLLTIEEHV